MFSSLTEFIKRHNIITIFSHIYPDGDAIGSMVGAQEIIKANFPDKEVYVVGENKEPFLTLLGPLDVVSDEVISNSAALVVDIANADRVFDQRFRLAKDSFKVDHHVFVENFTNEEIVKTNRIAASEILGEYVISENLKISQRGASALALGITTDSGRFVYDLTSALTFKVMSYLLENGADFKFINDVLGRRKLEGLKTRGYFMMNYVTYKNVIYISLTHEELTKLGLTFSEGSAFVNTYSGYEGYPTWATFFSDENGLIYSELRSKSHNVQRVARAFGGGGHLKASGCRLENKEEIIKVLEALVNAEEIA